jgi:hypothetical protein
MEDRPKQLALEKLKICACVRACVRAGVCVDTRAHCMCEGGREMNGWQHSRRFLVKPK